MMSCEVFEELCGELVLATGSGEERASALAHAGRCPQCRRRLEELTRVVDGVLLIGPTAEPPPGFEERTLARLVAVPGGGGQRAIRRVGGRRLNRGRLLALAAAVVLAAAAGGAWFTLRGDGAGQGRGDAANGALGLPGVVRTLAMLDASGRPVGRIDLGRRPATLFLALPGWAAAWSQDGEQPSYRLRLRLERGSQVELGPVTFSPGRDSWGTVVDFDTAAVQQVALLAADGTVLCHADAVG